MPTAAELMIKARSHLVMGHPFFGSLALRLKIEPDPSVETANCDGETIRYNPTWVESMPLSKVQGMVAHETMHPALLHHTRRGSRDPYKWNMACDYAINGMLVKAGFDLPDGGCVNKAYDGFSAEHIYTLLPDEPPGKGKNPSSDPGGCGGVADSPHSQNKGASQSQQEVQETEWKMSVAQATFMAKQAGKMPADMDRILNDLFEPVLPWKAMLRRFMSERAQDDFSWRRGNRRFIHMGLYLPTRESESVGEIVVVIDTSGSITDKELQEFGNEIGGIIQDVRPSKTTIIYCDCKVQRVDTFGPDDELVLKAQGGGGTDFRPPYTYLEQHGIVPKCLVYLTDADGPFPTEESSFPTLWVVNNHRHVPPHGEHLILEV